MVRIVAILRPYRLKDVLQKLQGQPSIHQMHFQEVRGYGRQKDHLDDYSADDAGLAFLPKIRLELLVDELFSEQVVESIASGARTGRIGDGKIFLLQPAAVFGV